MSTATTINGMSANDNGESQFTVTAKLLGSAREGICLFLLSYHAFVHQPSTYTATHPSV